MRAISTRSAAVISPGYASAAARGKPPRRLVLDLVELPARLVRLGGRWVVAERRRQRHAGAGPVAQGEEELSLGPERRWRLVALRIATHERTERRHGLVRVPLGRRAPRPPVERIVGKGRRARCRQRVQPRQRLRTVADGESVERAQIGAALGTAGGADNRTVLRHLALPVVVDRRLRWRWCGLGALGGKRRRGGRRAGQGGELLGRGRWRSHARGGRSRGTGREARDGLVGGRRILARRSLGRERLADRCRGGPALLELVHP